MSLKEFVEQITRIQVASPAAQRQQNPTKKLWKAACYSLSETGQLI